MNSNKIISLILLGISLTSVATPVIVYADTNTTATQVKNVPIENINNATLATDFADETKIALSKIESILQIAEKNPTQQTVEDVMKAFTSITLYKADLQFHKSDDQFDEIFLKIVDVTRKLPSDIRNKEFISFDKMLIKSLSNTKESNMGSFYGEYILQLKKCVQIPEIQNELDKAVIEMLNKDNAPTDDRKQGESSPVDNGKVPGYVEEPSVSNKPRVLPFDDLSSFISYVKEGKYVYKITKYFDKTGNLVKTTKELASKDEYVFAGVYDYVNLGGRSSSVNKSSARRTANLYNYVTNNQNPESNLTVQYTINKDEDTPYYYDTGIRTSLDGKISFEQLRDVLYQVSIKSGGYFTEDTNKLLSIVEGKPILTNNTKTSYTKDDINTLFKNFKKVDVTILETRIGKSSNLEEKIITKEAKNIKINDQDIELRTAPIVKKQRALLPIEQIANGLGANVNIVGNKYIITKNNTVVVYELDKDYVLVNGHAVVMGTSPDMKDTCVMAEVQEMAKALGYDMLWDGETGTIRLSNN